MSKPFCGDVYFYLWLGFHFTVLKNLNLEENASHKKNNKKNNYELLIFFFCDPLQA